MRHQLNSLSILSLLTLALLPFAHAQAAPNCSLAASLDAASYATLTMDGGSEADQDRAAYDWSQCRAAALGASLSRNPQLRARIDTLRKQYRQMRDLESDFAGIRNGGGTMYGHAVPRSYAPLEDRLQSLAALARTALGGQTSRQYAQTIQQARELQANYVKTLRDYKPKPDETYVPYVAKDWNAKVNRYEALGKSIMQTLGSRNDAATALGYSMLTDWVFAAQE